MSTPSNAHIVLNSRDRTNASFATSYNDAQFNSVNQNIIQGNIERIGVNEVNFPYDIPNMQDGFNYFYMKCKYTPAIVLEIVVAAGFYTGTELAVIINSKIVSKGLIQSLIQAQLPILAYDTVTNRFSFAAPTTSDSNYQVWQLFSSYTFYSPTLTTPVITKSIGKDIFSIMGFQIGQDNTINPAVETEDPLYGAGSAPLAFTQYIDVSSPQLCKFQYFRDGSTTNLSRRSDIICRLYVSNNVAIQENEGTRPFVINRQFLNSRMMKWTADNAVGTIDIQLFDDCGQPLQTTWQPRNYQITFNAYEGREDTVESDNGNDMTGYTPPRRHGAYQNKNAIAWANLERHQK